MFRKLNSVCFFFSRSRLRRGPQIDDRLKDYSNTYRIKKQINEHRKRFERSTQQTFTEVLADPKPKLQQRFKVDTASLNRNIKQIIKNRIKPELLDPVTDKGDDLKFLEEGRSHLNDQRAEVEFQQKFDKQLFMKKETNRLLKKQANDHKNFLPGSEDNRYNKYLQARNKLKNKRIQSMMNYKRNNEELQLLIDSGLMDHPDNIRAVIQKLAQPEGVQQLEERMESQIRQIQDSKAKSLSLKQESSQNHLTLEGELKANMVGPEQLRDYSKVEQFMNLYQASDEQDKLKSAENVDLLLQVREYERNLFLSRYDQINFRFKGRVKFENFKQFQLLSYIKHEQIEPLQLLEMFQQNKEKLSKFNVPVVTPAVMSRIYSRTSTYRFAEDDENNRINLLAHPSFVALERTLFRELDKISDELYCDAVWTYATNHEQEEGILNVAMSNAIQKAIFNEMLERIGRLRQVDLGLLVRSIMKMNLVKNEDYQEQWGEVIEVLAHRLPMMKEPYQYESVLEFVHLLPTSQASVQAIVSNINFFDKYEWECKGTLLTFSRICSILLNNNKIIDKLQHNKAFLRLSQIIINKTEQLKKIIPTLTINEISNVLLVFGELNKFPLKEIPAILINVAKKEIVDSIHMQKTKVYQYTVPTLINTLSNYDYYKNNIKTYSKYIDSNDLLTPYQIKHVTKLVALKHLLPARTFVFNSKLYFVYHQLARFLEAEYNSLSLKSVAQSIFGLSLVQYKNEGIYDSLSYKILEKLQKQQMEQQKKQLTLKQTNELIKIINAYSLQKRNTNVVEQIYNKILKQGKTNLKQIPINILISFFGSYVNIFSLPTEHPQANIENYDQLFSKWQRNKASVYIFTALYRDLFSHFLSNLQIEEIIVLYIINTHFLNNTSRILENKDNKIQSDFIEIHKRIKKNVIQLAKKIGQLPIQSLKIDYKFAISLCLKLNKEDITQNMMEESDYHNFEKLEREFYNRYIEQILAHEQHVGTSVTQKQVYQNVLAKLKKQSPEEIVNEGTWTIEIPSQKKVYFIATYEHLMSKTNDSQTFLGLFGLWKLYSQLYRRKKWTFHLVCSMLE